MSIDLIIIAALSIAAVAGSIVLVARDGYRRVPTRRA
ncbi:hypothetical protein BH10ACT7_BH10ACT7_18490 [soil metagenome]